MRSTPSRTTLRRPAVIAATLLALTLAAVPFLPDDPDEQGSITPSATTPRTPNRGVVTAEMRAEIERVVAAGATLPTTSDRAAAARAAVRCATFEDQRYCLGVGWTEQTAAEVSARLRSGRGRVGRGPATWAPPPSSTGPPPAARPPGSGWSAPS
ncbi:MAG: hypothetical protein LH477_18855 [Nocardioides sp.]|nr:hypothetical protein [Nocardioides sp.]